MNGDDVKTALTESVRLAEELELPYTLVGALTLGFYGTGRATHDVDLMIDGRTEDLHTIRCAGGFDVRPSRVVFQSMIHGLNFTRTYVTCSCG